MNFKTNNPVLDGNRKNKDIKCMLQIQGYTKSGHSKFWTKCIQYVFFLLLLSKETAKVAEQEEEK